MLGVKTIKKDLAIVIGIGQQVAKANEDGKITLLEYIGIGTKALKIWEIVKNAKEAWAEFKDLDDTERQELSDFFNEEFDIKNDNLEHIIESAFLLLISMAEFTDLFK